MKYHKRENWVEITVLYSFEYGDCVIMYVKPTHFSNPETYRFGIFSFEWNPAASYVFSLLISGSLLATLLSVPLLIQSLKVRLSIIKQEKRVFYSI